MEQCLVTRLKSATNNGGLKYFNAIKLTVLFGSSGAPDYVICINDSQQVFIGGIGVGYKVISNGHFKDGSGNIIDDNGFYYAADALTQVRFYPVDGTKSAEFVIVGLVDITALFTAQARSFIRIEDMYAKEVQYLRNLQLESTIYPYASLPVDEGIYSLDYIKDIPAEKKSLVSTIVIIDTTDWRASIDLVSLSEFVNLTEIPGASYRHGDISSIANLTKLTTLNFNSKVVSGSIESLGKLVALTDLYLYNTDVNGDLKVMALAQINNPSNPRTTGTIKVNPNGKITFNGVPVSSGHKTLSWTSENDITLTDGGW